MPDTAFRLILPVCFVFVVIGLVAHRARMLRWIGRDPIVIRPFQQTDAPDRYLESALAVGSSALVLDVLANAVSPPLVQEHLAISVLRTSARVGWFGLSLVLVGLLVASAGVMSMTTAWRIGIDRDNPGPLVRTGMFRHIRHPIYAGMLLITSGMAMATADVLSIAVAAASWVGIPLQARIEEEFLGSTYGADYERYRASTGRFFPRVRR